MQELKESMVSDREVAHAAEGKSVRACDNCVRKRARWYCAADDAFLCDTCDFSVHSENPLARRHERVRLKIASSSKENEISLSMDDDWRAGARPPSWHEGFTQKARTPRRQKRRGKLSSIIPMHLVPEQEVCSEEESEEQLLYRVPVFDLFEVENYGENSLRFGKSESDEFRRENNEFQGIVLPSKPDLAEFAADVESLLGKGLDDEAFDMEGMRIFHCDDGDDDVEGGAKECSLRIKAEDEEINRETTATDEGNLLRIDLGRETFELNFDYASPITCEEDNKVRILEKDDSSKALLKLDYDRVMSAWDHKKSPWMSGERPELNSGDWWPDCCLGTSGTTHAYGEMAVTSGQAAGGDGRRKARVSRYREKRRTRLFSKKIRYEVRKLNAEKRPRMKGRFMKRTSFAASAFPLLNK